MIQTTSSGAVILLHIHRFHHLRAQLGYTRCHALMAELERQLQASTRPGDSTLSLGSGQILVIAPGASTTARAAAVGEHLLSCLERVLAESRDVPPVRATVGISRFPVDETRPLELLRKAETALLTARDEDLGPLAIFEPSTSTRSLGEAELACALADALRQGALQVAYQPRVDASSGQLVGLEALARWDSPEHGSIAPGRFVPLAEEHGLIAALTEAVLRRVCDDAPRWRALGGPALRVSVNLSAVELGRVGRGEQLLELIAERGASPEWLEFELTESSLVRHPEPTQRALEVLRSAGATIAIDDFGTGYASLACLVDFPVDTLKIDRRFVSELCRDPHAVELVRVIASLGERFGLALVGEGAETREEVRLLRALGVSVIQGFFYSRPVPLEDCQTSYEIIEAAALPAGEPEIPSACSLPILPAVMAELLSLRQDTPQLDSRVRSLAEAEPALAAHLLVRAMQKYPREDYSLDEALAAFGAWPLVTELRRSMSHQAFLPSTVLARSVWLHAIQTACWASAIAPHVEGGPSEQRAYLAGLLHDLGRLLELQQAPEVTARVERQGYQTPAQLREREQQLQILDHATRGSAAAQAWGLGDALRAAIAHHHDPQLPSALSRHRRVVQLVRLADMLSLMMLGGIHASDPSDVVHAERIRALAWRQQVVLVCAPETLAGLWAAVDRRSQLISERLMLPL